MNCKGGSAGDGGGSWRPSLKRNERGDKIKALIRAEAKKLGIDAVGFAVVDDSTRRLSDLKEFVDLGLHGDMDWLARDVEVRADPAKMWPEVKSIIALGMNYSPETDPLELLDKKDIGNISVYARNRDYHDILKGRLKHLASKIAKFAKEKSESADESALSRAPCASQQASAGANKELIKLFVDTAPVMEKPLAELAGIGWQGKHSCLVSRQFGSWLFLGIIYTNIEITPDEKEPNHCGSCRKCLDICPTNAFIAEHKIDATKCISYLTIEHKGHIDEVFRKPIGNRIYGCDDCLAVCPWNKFAKTATETGFHARDSLRSPAIADLLELDDATFRKMFSASPIKRVGVDRFLRNVLIAAGNSGDLGLISKVKKLIGSKSPLVRAMAVWALKQLATEEEFAACKNRFINNEHDGGVLQEWLR